MGVQRSRKWQSTSADGGQGGAKDVQDLSTDLCSPSKLPYTPARWLRKHMLQTLGARLDHRSQELMLPLLQPRKLHRRQQLHRQRRPSLLPRCKPSLRLFSSAPLLSAAELRTKILSCSHAVLKVSREGGKGAAHGSEELECTAILGSHSGGGAHEGHAGGARLLCWSLSAVCSAQATPCATTALRAKNSAMLQVVKERPEDPLDYLAQYLIRHNPKKHAGTADGAKRD